MGEISVLGGIFLMSSGLGILQIRDCKTLNMLPALLVPPAFYALVNVVKSFWYRYWELTFSFAYINHYLKNLLSLILNMHFFEKYGIILEMN